MAGAGAAAAKRAPPAPLAEEETTLVRPRVDCDERNRGQSRCAVNAHAGTAAAGETPLHTP